MARSLRIQYEGAVYHVTCRGNERRDIFRDDDDRRRFLAMLGRSANIYSVKICGYVLMNNHFHLLAETPLGNLSEFMRNFNITYTGYFNRRHKRTGHLYQGRYYSILVDRDAYLSTVSRYIHLNPIRVKELEKATYRQKLRLLTSYRWSSLPGYLHKSKKEPYVDHSLVLGEHGGDTARARRSYAKSLYAEAGREPEMHGKVVGQSIIGGEKFLNWVKDEFLGSKKEREKPSVKGIQTYLGRDVIIRAIEQASGKRIADIKSGKGPLRQLTMELLYKAGRLRGPEIGALFGIDYSAVSQERKRFREKMEKDRVLKGLHDSVLENMSTVKI